VTPDRQRRTFLMGSTGGLDLTGLGREFQPNSSWEKRKIVGFSIK